MKALFFALLTLPIVSFAQVPTGPRATEIHLLQKLAEHSSELSMLNAERTLGENTELDQAIAARRQEALSGPCADAATSTLSAETTELALRTCNLIRQSVPRGMSASSQATMRVYDIHELQVSFGLLQFQLGYQLGAGSRPRAASCATPW